MEVEKEDTVKILGKDWDFAIKPEVKIFTLDEIKNKLVKYQGWGNIPYEFKADTKGFYYIKIHDDWDDGSSEKPFMIMIK